MQKKSVTFPAISPELEFVARRWQEADDIFENRIPVEASLKKLSDAAYEKADKDASETLKELTIAVGLAAKGVLRINWSRYSRWNWYIRGDVYMAHGPKRTIGYTGLLMEDREAGPRLIGWINPRGGGLDNRRKFVRFLKKKVPNILVASDDPKRFPGWSGNEDGVVWFESKLSIRTSIDGLRLDIARKAKVLYKHAKPLLKKLANQ